MTERPLTFMERLSPDERAALCALGMRRAMQKSELLFRAGEPGDAVYLLEHGRVKIFHPGLANKEVLLWFCTPGDIFGVSEIGTAAVRQVSARANEDGSLLVIPSSAFRSFIAGSPSAAFVVLEILSERLRALGHRVQDLSTGDVAERVVHLIGRLCTQYGKPDGEALCIDLPITHQEMGEMIGATRQSVTSAVSELRRKGFVSMRGRRICVAAGLLNKAGASNE